MQNNGFRNASRFLLFTYYGLDFNVDKDEAIKKAIDIAYKDATLMGAFNTKKDKNDNGEDRKNKVVEALEEQIDDFEKWHSDLCSDLEENDKGFSFGNAQKLVNMTIKNMHIVYSVINEFNPDNKFVSFFKENFLPHYSAFHIPVDDYILEAAWVLESENDKRDSKIIKFPIKDSACKTKYGKYNSEKINRWSSWNDETYYAFQNSLKDFIRKDNPEKSPLDWEYDAWIATAKNRKDQK